MPRGTQNTQYYGGGEMASGERMKNEKREKEKEENCIKMGGKGHKNASFLVINSIKFPPPSNDINAHV